MANGWSRIMSLPNYRDSIKRGLDLILTSVALLVLAPLVGMMALMVRLNIGSPIFFYQERPGLNGKLFLLIKFRTMTDAMDQEGSLLPDAQRLTRFGAFLRSTSLDELPELINVLRGEMSLVGPRPLLTRYLVRYSPEQMKRHDVRPGITGWAQVNGRNAISWEAKFELDAWYVNHLSFSLDLRIMWMTVLKVIKREGITEQGQATATEFLGSPYQPD